MKTLLAWLSDVYAKSGYVAVLVSLVVIVGLVVGVCLLFGIAPVDFAKWFGMY